MATRILPFQCVIPGDTLITTPISIPINLDGWTVEQFDLEVPPGASGAMGFQIYNNGVPYIPYGAGQWIVWDDRAESYPLDELPNAGGWAVVGYNSGFYPHTVIVRAHVSSVAAVDPPVAIAGSGLEFVTTTAAEPVQL